MIVGRLALARWLGLILWHPSSQANSGSCDWLVGTNLPALLDVAEGALEKCLHQFSIVESILYIEKACRLRPDCLDR